VFVTCAADITCASCSSKTILLFVKKNISFFLIGKKQPYQGNDYIVTCISDMLNLSLI